MLIFPVMHKKWWKFVGIWGLFSSRLIYISELRGHLLYRSIPIGMSGPPVTWLSWNSREKSIRIACRGSVSTSRPIFSLFGSWYFIFLPELMQGVHVLQFSFMSYRILAHQKMLLSVSIFVEPGCPKCNALTTCFSNSSGFTILSPEKSKPNRSVSMMKTGEISLRSLLLLNIHYTNFQLKQFQINRSFVD